MLPPLLRLRLENAPVGTGTDGEEEAKRRKVGATNVAPNVLMGLPSDIWLNIMQNVDYVEACNEIARICLSANNEPWRSLCQKDFTYEMLNRKMGLYGDGGTLATMKTWFLTSGTFTPLGQYIALKGGATDFTARNLLEYVCLNRKRLVNTMKRYRRLPADEQREQDYRLHIQVFLQYESPIWGAQAKWVVGLHPSYAFEFIPGSMTTHERKIPLDLVTGLPYNDPIRESARQEHIIMSSKYRDNGAGTWADIAVPNWVEIAKMVIKDFPHNFKHIPGWVDDASGSQPFPPCKGFAEIAKLAMEGDPFNFVNVPGSTLDPQEHTSERFFPDAVSNYTELAKLAANAVGMLQFVPGSIDLRSGNQLRRPIPDYYDIAEVHLRKRGYYLRYVPPDLPGYAALAKIAIDKHPGAFKYVPTDHKDYKDLEAHRDASVAKDR